MQQYKELVLSIAATDDNNDSNDVKQKINKEKFILLFDGKIGKELCGEIFNMIREGVEDENDDNNDDNKDNEQKCITQFDIIKFMEGHRVARHVRKVTVKDGINMLLYVY